MDRHLDVVIIGAGQAGLAVSYHLRALGIDHVVFERGEVGESWRSQRWDSFHLNTPNWANGLPGLEFDPDRPDDFAHRGEVVSFFERYVRSFDLPVSPLTPVHRVQRRGEGGYSVHTDDGSTRAHAVVLASGAMSRSRVPSMAYRLPTDLMSIAAGEYRSAHDLPNGAAVVVGTGQSGCQIAEDLLQDGRRVFVCASRVARCPRVYRGRDILAWWRDMGFLDVGLEELEDPSMQFAAQPQVSGTEGGHTVSLQSLARDGATLLGRVDDAGRHGLTLSDDLRDSIAFADQKAELFKSEIDAWIDRQGLVVEDPEPDPGEPPLPDLWGSDRLRTLDLRGEDVSSIIWCTGFDANWSWVEVDVFDPHGRPKHQGGVTDSRGLYFAGLPWLSKRKSGILYGVPEDAARIVGHIRRHVLDREAV
jgi:putative flavoprotein involved in K+ transport